MTGRVLVGVDCSPRSIALLRWADEQALALGDILEVITTWGDGVPGAAHETDLDVRSAVERALDRTLVNGLSATRAAAAHRRVSGARPVDELVRRSFGADLLVVGAHHRHHDLPLGSITAEVVAQAHCPVVVLRDPPCPDADTIVVGVDNSVASREALRWSIEFAARSEYRVVALTVEELLPDYPLPSTTLAPSDSQRLIADLGELPASAWVPVTVEVRNGRPARALLDAAEGAALLVVGNNGGGRVAGCVLGSVSQRVARQSSTPVVVVHPWDRAAAGLRRADEARA